MAKKLDPQEIEQSRRKKTRADNREERKERIHDGIRKNRESGGVIVIPPPPAVQAQGQAPRKMRVAAYVRVSTQEEQQVGSFEMQIVYFKSKIESNPDWELVKIYQDYGVSGTSTNKRQGFKDMIDDAKAGKIDLILTKGINRFGRNTVDILNNLRTLNALTPPVPVRFGITAKERSHQKRYSLAHGRGYLPILGDKHAWLLLGPLRAIVDRANRSKDC